MKFGFIFRNNIFYIHAHKYTYTETPYTHADTYTKEDRERERDNTHPITIPFFLFHLLCTPSQFKARSHSTGYNFDCAQHSVGHHFHKCHQIFTFHSWFLHCVLTNHNSFLFKIERIVNYWAWNLHPGFICPFMQKHSVQSSISNCPQNYVPNEFKFQVWLWRFCTNTWFCSNPQDFEKINTFPVSHTVH